MVKFKEALPYLITSTVGITIMLFFVNTLIKTAESTTVLDIEIRKKHLEN